MRAGCDLYSRLTSESLVDFLNFKPNPALIAEDKIQTFLSYADQFVKIITPFLVRIVSLRNKMVRVRFIALLTEEDDTKLRRVIDKFNFETTELSKPVIYLLAKHVQGNFIFRENFYNLNYFDMLPTTSQELSRYLKLVIAYVKDNELGFNNTEFERLISIRLLQEQRLVADTLWQTIAPTADELERPLFPEAKINSCRLLEIFEQGELTESNRVFIKSFIETNGIAPYGIDISFKRNGLSLYDHAILKGEREIAKQIHVELRKAVHYYAPAALSILAQYKDPQIRTFDEELLNLEIRTNFIINRIGWHYNISNSESISKAVKDFVTVLFNSPFNRNIIKQYLREKNLTFKDRQFASLLSTDSDLITASHFYSTAAVELILEAMDLHRNPRKLYNERVAAANFAMRNNLLDIISIFINTDPHVSTYIFDVLNASIALGRSRVAINILNDMCTRMYKYFFIKKLNEALYVAAQYGRTPLVELLLKLGANKDSLEKGTGDTAMHKAAAFGHLDIVSLLMNVGAKDSIVNKEGETPLNTAVTQENSDIVSYFLTVKVKNIQSLGTNRKTLFHIAAENGAFSTLDLLLAVLDSASKPILDCQAKDSLGNTAIHLVVSSKKINYLIKSQMLDKLITLGLAVDSKNNKGDTGLHTAIANNDLMIVLKLINLGAKLGITNKTGQTAEEALKSSALNDNTEINKCLVIFRSSLIRPEMPHSFVRDLQDQLTTSNPLAI